MPSTYARALVEVGQDDEDRLVALAALKSLGMREITRGSGSALIEVWFECSAAECRTLVDTWSVTVREITTVEEADWMAGARAHAQPLPVGERFVLDPREPEADEEDQELLTQEGQTQRWLLRLPARRAFGTGTHETTQLMVQALEASEVAGRRVLDAGSGTGVLSFVSMRLGARAVVGFDLDLASAFVGRENCPLNGFDPGVSPGFFAGDSGCLAEDARFDMVLVNVLPERIAGSEAVLARCVGAGGRLLLAGQLVEQQEQVLDCWTCHGLVAGRKVSLGEWSLVELLRPVAA